MICACGVLPPEWWRDPGTFRKVIGAHGTHAAVREAHGTSLATLSKWRGRHDGGVFVSPDTNSNAAGVRERAGVTFRDGRASVVTDPKEGAWDLNDLDALLSSRGLDPADWTVDRVTVNEWEGYAGRDAPTGGETVGEPRVVALHQLKAYLTKRVDMAWVFPAVDVTERHRPEPGTKEGGARLVWLGGDEQARYNDPQLERALLRWLADVQPDELVGLGDLMDFPTISRHGDRPSWSATAQECIDAGYRLLSDRRDACPDARYRMLRGNHDWRLESEMLTRAERMFGIKPADDGGRAVAALSLRNLLHLDALAIELVGVEGDKWEMGRVDVAPGLVAQHRLPKGPRVRASVVAGDSHRQSIRQVTEWDDGVPTTRTFVEAGCLCLPHGGLGYAVDPDWQQGFVTAAVDDDGRASFDLAYWRDGQLTWRGETWRGRR